MTEPKSTIKLPAMEITILGTGGGVNAGLPYNAFLIDDSFLCETPPDIMLTVLLIRHMNCNKNRYFMHETPTNKLLNQDTFLSILSLCSSHSLYGFPVRRFFLVTFCTTHDTKPLYPSPVIETSVPFSTGGSVLANLYS